MRTFTKLLAFSSLLFTSLATLPARAESDVPASVASVPRADRADLRLDVQTLWLSTPHGSGVGAGATAMGRTGLFQAGIGGQASVMGWRTHLLSAGVLAGIGIHPNDRLRLDFLAEVGFDQYEGVGAGGFLSNDLGSSSSSLPYVGLRVGAVRRWRWFELGGCLTVADDIRRDHYAAEDRAENAPGRDIGGARLEAMFTLGVPIDL
jgi:hypothetical protein